MNTFLHRASLVASSQKPDPKKGDWADPDRSDWNDSGPKRRREQRVEDAKRELSWESAPMSWRSCKVGDKVSFESYDDGLWEGRVTKVEMSYGTRESVHVDCNGVKGIVVPGTYECQTFRKD